jgi:hypothetical protein
MTIHRSFMGLHFGEVWGVPRLGREAPGKYEYQYNTLFTNSMNYTSELYAVFLPSVKKHLWLGMLKGVLPSKANPAATDW